MEVAQPIEATKALSRDQSHAWPIELKDGRTISAIDIQRLYLDKAGRYCDRTDRQVDWLLREWERVLNDLEVDLMRCVDRIDWVAKWYLLSTFQEAEKLEWTDPWLQAIDLEYHNLAWDQGLHHELARAERVRRVVSEQEVKAAVFNPPESTRAFFRGRAVARFTPYIEALRWDEVVFGREGGPPYRVWFNSASEDARLARLNAAMREAINYEDLIRRLQQVDSRGLPQKADWW